MPNAIPTRSYEQVRSDLLNQNEIALIDVREEGLYAQGHPLFAANFPAGRLELEAWSRIPRLGTPIVVYDNGEGVAEAAVRKLVQFGYTQVTVLEGGLRGWRELGGEVFRDMHVPSKAFGELVNVKRATPSLSAEEVMPLVLHARDVVVLDTRRFEDYQATSIPGAIHVPADELVLRVRALALPSTTRIVVHCAGRARSIFGAQSLVDAGIENPVYALRNGTMGWVLAGLPLERGAQRRCGAVDPQLHADASARARAVADRCAVQRAGTSELEHFERDALQRTTYYFDVRSAEEFSRSHLPGFRNAPGAQLVQQTDQFAPVRGARLVLMDADGVSANLSASWLAQMGWEVWVLDGVRSSDFIARSPDAVTLPPPEGSLRWTTSAELAQWITSGTSDKVAVLDFTSSANYARRHIPGAWFVLRAQLARALRNIPAAQRYVLTCGTSLLARYVAQELSQLTDAEVYVLRGGTQAWIETGLPLQHGQTRMASDPIDRHRRPDEGLDHPRDVLQAYIAWKHGLVEQLERDGTHRFAVI